MISSWIVQGYVLIVEKYIEGIKIKFKENYVFKFLYNKKR